MATSIGNFKVDSELLISLVEERPELWDKTTDEYKDKTKTQDAWNEICSILKDGFERLTDKEKNELGKNIIKKWTNLRDNWMKWNKKHIEQKRSGGGAKPLRKYLYHDQLLFLKKVASHKVSASSILVSQDPEEETSTSTTHNALKRKSTSESINTHTASISRKRKMSDDVEIKMRNLSENEKEQNRHISFFHGVLPSLNEFDEEQTLDFQMGVLQLIKNIKTSKTESMAEHQRFYIPHRRSSVYEFPQTVVDCTLSGSATSCPQNIQACDTLTSATSYSSRCSSVTSSMTSPTIAHNNHPQDDDQHNIENVTIPAFKEESPSPSTPSTVHSED